MSLSERPPLVTAARRAIALPQLTQTRAERCLPTSTEESDQAPDLLPLARVDVAWQGAPARHAHAAGARPFAHRFHLLLEERVAPVASRCNAHAAHDLVLARAKPAATKTQAVVRLARRSLLRSAHVPPASAILQDVDVQSRHLL